MSLIPTKKAARSAIVDNIETSYIQLNPCVVVAIV